MPRKVSQDEIEKWTELRRRGYSYDKIGKETGWSGATVRKYLTDADVGFAKGSEGEVSGEFASQAFRLFEEGKSPVKVVQELKANPDKIKRLWEQYMELSNQDLAKIDKLEKRIDELEEDRDELFDNVVFSANLNDVVTRDWVCEDCGSRGNVAVAFRCTACRNKGYFGWWP